MNALLGKSIAAGAQSFFYGAYTTGFFSLLQSAGVAGLGLTGNTVAATVGAGTAATVKKGSELIMKNVIATES